VPPVEAGAGPSDGPRAGEKHPRDKPSANSPNKQGHASKKAKHGVSIDEPVDLRKVIVISQHQEDHASPDDEDHLESHVQKGQ